MPTTQEDRIQTAIRHYTARTAPPPMPVNATPAQLQAWIEACRQFDIGNFAVFSNTFNFGKLSFAFSLNLVININIVINIQQKSMYGVAKYGVDVYDPVTLFGILVPNEVTKFLATEMVRKFVPATTRGYKYALFNSFFYLDASLPIFTAYAPEPIWPMRFRRMEANKNWTCFFDLSFFDVGSFPTDPLLRPFVPVFDTCKFDLCKFGDSLQPDDISASEMFVRFTDLIESCLDWGHFDMTKFDSNEFLTDMHPRTTRDNNITSNMLDYSFFDRCTFVGENFLYPELYLLVPFVVAYTPAFDCMNFDVDVLASTVDFNESTLTDIISSFDQRSNPIYRQANLFQSSERMVLDYSIHATFQGNLRDRTLRILQNKLTSPTQLTLYNAFVAEYVYKRKYYQLIEGELVIQKYIKLGLDETLLRQLAAMSQR